MSKQTDPHEWLRFAQNDLAAARLLLTNVDLPPRMACFHAQQAAEKALKASLLRAAIQFRKTHDLVVLVSLQPEPLRSEVGELDLQHLQQWAMDARHPADLPEITSSDAVAVVAIAEQLVARVASVLREGVGTGQTELAGSG